MPIRYERDNARRRVVVTVEGPFAVADFLAVIERQRGDGVWTYGMLCDLRGMTGEPAIDDLRQFMSEAEGRLSRRVPLRSWPPTRSSMGGPARMRRSYAPR